MRSDVLRRNAGLFWRWFKYWRKRYMWLRLAIIVLLFAEPVYGVFHPLIRDLVVYAIQGIETATSRPRRYVDYYQFQEKKRLQKRLLARFDATKDGRLEAAEATRLRAEAGLSAQQVTGSGLGVALDPLLEANRKLGLVSSEVTPRSLRRAALNAALAEMDRQHKESHAEIDPMLEMQYPGWRDYLKWETWKRGVSEFRVVLAARGSYIAPLGYFTGILRHTHDPMESDYLPYEFGWRGYIGWVVLLLIIVLCVVRYGKHEELRKRFQEDAELALAPCPIRKTPTHDYGALLNHRSARAWATAAVAGLAFVALNALARSGADNESAFATGLLVRPAQSVGALLVITMAGGILRWLLWPREVHMTHRWPRLLIVGFAVSTVLVVWLLGCVVAFSMRSFDWPRRTIAVASMRRERPRSPVERARGALAARPVTVPGQRAAAPAAVSRAGQRQVGREPARRRAGRER